MGNDQKDMPEAIRVFAPNITMGKRMTGDWEIETSISPDTTEYKRADLVVDKALAEEILEAVTDPAAYAYFRGRLKSIRGEG